MSGVAKSIGGFLGTSGGPTAPDYQGGNAALSGLNAYATDPNNADFNATGATTGSNFATSQVQGNPLMSHGLNNMQGQLQAGQGLQAGQTDKLNQLQSQGFNLKPEDYTQYGQESGDIARQFGQQGNQTANDLAQRGLSSSGAAGAQFSGLAGSQNEMLSKAQQQIAQTRFQNTMGQIGQQQQFLGQLNAQNNQAAGAGANTAANMVNQQYGRQVEGQNSKAGIMGQAAGLQNQSNQAQNSYGLAKAGFDADHTPANFGDYLSSGFGKGLQQQGNNMSDPFNSGSGSPGSMFGSMGKGMMGA